MQNINVYVFEHLKGKNVLLIYSYSNQIVYVIKINHIHIYIQQGTSGMVLSDGLSVVIILSSFLTALSFCLR